MRLQLAVEVLVNLITVFSIRIDIPPYLEKTFNAAIPSAIFLAPSLALSLGALTSGYFSLGSLDAASWARSCSMRLTKDFFCFGAVAASNSSSKRSAHSSCVGGSGFFSETPSARGSKTRGIPGRASMDSNAHERTWLPSSPFQMAQSPEKAMISE